MSMNLNPSLLILCDDTFFRELSVYVTFPCKLFFVQGPQSNNLCHLDFLGKTGFCSEICGVKDSKIRLMPPNETLGNSIPSTHSSKNWLNFRKFKYL